MLFNHFSFSSSVAYSRSGTSHHFKIEWAVNLVASWNSRSYPISQSNLSSAIVLIGFYLCCIFWSSECLVIIRLYWICSSCSGSRHLGDPDSFGFPYWSCFTQSYFSFQWRRPLYVICLPSGYNSCPTGKRS